MKVGAHKKSEETVALMCYWAAEEIRIWLDISEKNIPGYFPTCKYGN